MKIRTDFVTNSSSSSFVILTKDNLNKKQLTEVLLEATGISTIANGMFPELAEDIVEALFADLKDIDIYEYLDIYSGAENINELKDFGIEGRAIYYNYTEYPYIKIGSVASDSDNPVEVMLVDMEIDFKNDKIVVVKAGGY